MTVKELKEILEKYHDDTVVLRQTGILETQYTGVVTVEYYDERAGWGYIPDSIIIR